MCSNGYHHLHPTSTSERRKGFLRDQKIKMNYVKVRP
jgi:hypothetical protein